MIKPQHIIVDQSHEQQQFKQSNMKSHQSKIAAKKLIDESGLQESYPRPQTDHPPTTPSRHYDQKEGNPRRDPRRTQAARA
jgi:hypothetical protein